MFQEIRASLVKATVSDSEKSPEEMETAIRQLVSRAVSSTEVVDIFAAAGLDKSDISILSDEFLTEVKQLPQRNLALELLKKLLGDEIKTRMRKNVVQARSFAKMLEAQKRSENLGLNDDEIAFYDALEVNDRAVKLPRATT